MSLVCKSGIQAPEHLDDTKGCLGYRLGSIAAGRGYRSDYRQSAFSAIFSKVDYVAGTLVELCQTGTQVRRVTFLTGHLLQTSGHLTQSLRPAGGGVCHQRHRISHVTEILRDRNTGIDGCLTGCHRHIGCIGNQNGTFHQRLAGLRVLQLRELVQNVGHLVAALAAADVDHDVRLCPFRQLMLDNRLAASEGSRYGCHTAFCDGEEHVNDTLSGDQRHAGRKFLLVGTAFTHRPFLHQGHILVAVRRRNHCNHIFYRKFSRFDLLDGTLDTVGDHDPLLHYCSLLYSTDDISGFHRIAYDGRRDEVPFQITLQGGNLHTAL